MIAVNIPRVKRINGNEMTFRIGRTSRFKNPNTSPAIRYCSHEPETINPGTIMEATYNATTFPKIMMINLSIQVVEIRLAL